MSISEDEGQWARGKKGFRGLMVLQKTKDGPNFSHFVGGSRECCTKMSGPSGILISIMGG